MDKYIRIRFYFKSQIIECFDVRDLKSEFQHVEEKMRLAVESLHYPGLSRSQAAAQDQSGDSSGDSGRWSVTSGGGSSDLRGFYPRF